MVQDAAIEAVNRLRADDGLALTLTLTKVQSPSRWMCGIVRYVTLQYLRRETRRARLRDVNEWLICELLIQEEGRERDIERLVEQVLDMAKGVLTPKQQAVVSLVLDGETDAAIATALKIDAATVRSHRTTAVRRIRAAVKDSEG